jgi:CRISPR-associated protein Cas5d
MDIGPPLEVKVWGDFACFTRPEMKVERVSYPVMTPSAARGVLESIFWKPEFAWRVREIGVLRPIRYFGILRNEVNHRASDRSAREWATRGGGYVASESDNRAQRHTLALRDVAYVIRSDVVPVSGREEDAAKFRDQYRRRVGRGQCFLQPYLGCREFTAAFGPPGPSDRPIERTEALGRMLLDVTYLDRRTGRGAPRFFEAALDRGVLRVPAVGDRAEG